MTARSRVEEFEACKSRSDGDRLVERLRARWPGLRVLFVSGWQDANKTKLPPRDARTRFLQKPFDPVALLAKVAEILNP